MQRRRRRSALASAIRTLLAAGGMFGAHGAWANCTTVGLVTTCDATPPNPWTSTIGTGPNQAAGSTVVVGQDAGIVLGNASAISFADDASITVSAAAVVQSSAILGGGAYGSRNDTVQVRNNGLVTVATGGQVLALGADTQGEAINPQGTGNRIVNYGTVRATNAAAIWFQSPTGSNTIDNFGTIEGFGGTGNAFGGGGTLLFHNRETGVVRGNLIFGDGNDALFLYTGSVLTGALHGGGGSDTVTLRGTGSASLPGALDGFEFLTKRGDNTLTLTGTNTYTGLTTIEAGVLRIGDGGTQGTLAGDVANAGELAFDRADDWTFAGAIGGSGVVRQLGSGVLTLAGSNTYTGGTSLDAGVLRVTADANLGDPTGDLVFDGGTLRLDASFDTARDIRVDLGGGTFDVAGTTRLTGLLSGVGDVAKTGAGLLIVDQHADYAGLTRVLEGTLVVGDSAHADTQLVSGGGVEVAAGATFGGCGSVRATIRNDGALAVCNALEALGGEPGQHFSVLGTLFNAGLVDLSNGTADNQLLLDTYVAQGGAVALDVVLDAGGDTARSDRLIVGSVQNGGAPTLLLVNHLGGEGAATQGPGIPLVQGADPARSDADAFELARRVVAGPFEYLLAYDGAGTWSLQSEDPESGEPLLRPEIGAYLGNRRAATGLLTHSFYDRPDVPGHAGDVWMRTLGGNVRVDAHHGRIQARGGRSMLQFGAGVAQVLGVHMGVMLGATRSDVEVDVVHNPALAHGESDGVVGGVHATWFADDARRLGAYVDTWAQVGRFDNVVAGDTLAAEQYDADLWAASAEAGYAWAIGTRWTIEPQLQVLFTDYASDTVTEANGTRVSDLGGRETVSRVGVRFRGLDDAASPVRPYIEADLWHGDGMPAIAFNDRPVQGGVPNDRYVLKSGLMAHLSEQVTLFLQMEGEWGAHRYQVFHGQAGLHYRW